MVWEKLRKTLIRLNGSNIATTPTINFIEDTGINITASYDAVNNEIDLTFTNTGPGGGGLADADYGDVTVTGGGSIITIDADAVTTNKIQHKAVTLLKIQHIQSSRFLGRTTVGVGDTEELTGTQATTLLDTFSTSLKGLAPASGGGVTNFLRADGTWAAPSGGGGLGYGKVYAASLNLIRS